MDSEIIKHCSGCGFDLPSSQFHKRSASRDGLTSKCKACMADYDRARLHAPHRVQMRKTYQQSEAYRESADAARKSWRERNRDKVRAHSAVARALRRGTLIKQSCEVCGHYKTEAHHDDYSKPLDIRWLCDEHHKARHIELRIEARPFQDQRWNINSMLGFNQIEEPEPAPF